MPDILVFGATGYTGRLVAHALAERGASFAIAGRDRSKLVALAASTGNPDVRVVTAGDVDGLVEALDDCRVLITCVGPFSELGWTAAEAAVAARVNYLDSAGEASFVGRLIAEYGDRARTAGIAMAPALGFDEVPGDVAATLAADGFERPELVLTYALPSGGSNGTIKSALGILVGSGPWIRDGRQITITPGQHSRWSPMPPPLGPKPAVSFPFATGYLVPLHLDLARLELYATIGTPQRLGAKLAIPVLRAIHSIDGPRKLIERAVETVQRSGGPSEQQRQRWWTILAEARSGNEWRNVVIKGRDVYGLTAQLLSAGAIRMSKPDYDLTGVMAPVQALGLDFLTQELRDNGVDIETYAPVGT